MLSVCETGFKICLAGVDCSVREPEERWNKDCKGVYFFSAASPYAFRYEW